jgi:hypothetical protein
MNVDEIITSQDVDEEERQTTGQLADLEHDSANESNGIRLAFQCPGRRSMR